MRDTEKNALNAMAIKIVYEVFRKITKNQALF